MEPTVSDKTITVYVRKAGDGDRMLSFGWPPEISSKEALDHGYAMDGRSLVVIVTPDSPEAPSGSGYSGSCQRPLMRVLYDVQKDLCAWLEEKGYVVAFE